MNLERDEFKAWLEGLTPGAFAGYEASKWSCPIANFLVSKGARRPVVDNKRFQKNGSVHKVPRWPLPEWAVEFVGKVDSGAMYHGTPRAITASRALEILG